MKKQRPLKTIPLEYKKYWRPFKSNETIFHVTTRKNWLKIQRDGFIEPRDPKPQHWAGMRAVFFSDPVDPLHPSLPKLFRHIKESGDDMVRLHIRTKNKLYKSNAEKRTFHIMSLQPVPTTDIIEADYLKTILEKKIPFE